jgi:hypothetical protein
VTHRAGSTIGQQSHGKVFHRARHGTVLQYPHRGLVCRNDDRAAPRPPSGPGDIGRQPRQSPPALQPASRRIGPQDEGEASLAVTKGRGAGRRPSWGR